MSGAWATGAWATGAWAGTAWAGGDVPPPPTPTIVSIPDGVRRTKKRELIVKIADVRDRQDTAEFLKSQLNLRHPSSIFKDTSVDDAIKARELAAQQRREKEMRAKAHREREKTDREHAKLLAAMEEIEKRRLQKIVDDNNKAAILLATIASELDD